MDLNAVRDFIAVAEHGGYAEAGRMMGLPKSTLSRRIAMLEKELGVRLLERSSRYVRLTAEGILLRSRAATLMGAFAEIAEQIKPSDAPLTGRLRVSVPVLFGHTFLGQVAADYARTYPRVLLEAVVDDRQVDLLREGFDAALRINPRIDSDLTGRIVARNNLMLVAPPILARQLGHPREALDGSRWPAVVRRGWGDDGKWDILAHGKPVRVFAEPRLMLSSPLAIRDAVCAGAGAALLPQTLVRREVADGRLLTLGVKAGAPEEIWIVHASGQMPSRRLRAFIDLLTDFFGQQA